MNRLNVAIVRTYSLLSQFYTVFAILFPSPSGRGPGRGDKKTKFYFDPLSPTPLPEGEGLLRKVSLFIINSLIHNKILWGFLRSQKKRIKKLNLFYTPSPQPLSLWSRGLTRSIFVGIV